MNGYKVNPILRTVMTDQIDLIQACDREETAIVRYWINKIIADLEMIKNHTENQP